VKDENIRLALEAGDDLPEMLELARKACTGRRTRDALFHATVMPAEEFSRLSDKLDVILEGGNTNTCDNCGNVWPDENLMMVRDLETRVDPGGEMPSGECPECGCLCYLDKKEKP
jgi:hypothetical protein